MIKQAERSSKLGAKFVGPYRVVRNICGNRFELLEPNSRASLEVHSDRLKVISSPLDLDIGNSSSESNVQQDNTPTHSYNLRPRV